MLRALSSMSRSSVARLIVIVSDVVAGSERGEGREDAAVPLEDDAEGERLARALKDDDAAKGALAAVRLAQRAG